LILLACARNREIQGGRLRKICILLLATSSLFSAQIPDLFSVGIGVFEVTKDKYKTMELDIEYKAHFNCLKTPYHFLEFRPLIGVMANALGSGYVCLGIIFDLLFFNHLLLAPGFAAGYYWQGGGKNLGYPLEFRSSIELAWQFKSWHRLGVKFYHLSNASIVKKNPGEESLTLFYDIPITKSFPFGRN
jgi:lipid A 3-O-deacylase